MKIYTMKTLENGVCVSNVRTEDFSCEDIGRMADFGEPQINAGGTFSTGTQAEVTGDEDLSEGYDFSTLEERFTIAVNGSSAVTIQLDADCDDLAAVVFEINAKLAEQTLDGLVEAVESTDYVKLQSVAAGVSQTFILAEGTPGALAVLGIDAATYGGTGMDDFNLPNDIARVKSDSPFIGKFDSRDTDMATAKLRGDVYADELRSRIEDAMTALRAMTDDYSDETMITY